MIEQLKEIRSKLDAVIATLENKPDTPVSYERKPLPSNAKPAYDACKPLWEAAQKAGLFSIFDYVPGIQRGAAHISEQRDATKMNQDIIKLGFTAWGQEWLSHDENAALIDADYQRHFLGYRVVRKHQNDESQGYNRVP